MMLPKGMQDALLTMVQQALGGMNLQQLVFGAQQEYQLLKNQMNRIEEQNDEILQRLRGTYDNGDSNVRQLISK